MSKTISEVQAILQVEPGICRILLHKFKWNKDRLLDKFYEHSDTTEFLAEAQVIPKTSSSEEAAGSSAPPPGGDAECDVCCSMTRLSGLACAHRACDECWKAYLTEKIVDVGQSEIECMMMDCKLLIEDEKVNILEKARKIDFQTPKTANFAVWKLVFQEISQKKARKF